MGEVYRAEDLQLQEPVALKCLPEELSARPEALEQIRNEVRIARRVTHPNVCRVYDLGEAEGVVFLSMELIEGEDLASLLKRIGRFPSDKALEMARQLCAGLSAAHNEGVLHRDLKPANIMLDADGRVRIMDFGIAAPLDADQSANVIVGTPFYMAPEVLAGETVTQSSDIYSLGLLLYEIFTGKRTYTAQTLGELRRLHDTSTIPTPSSVVTDLEPAVERAILRCLQREPGERPETANAVAAELPGGDPLAAALAAGETPSPELIASAHGKRPLSAQRTALLLAICVLGIILISWADHRNSLLEILEPQLPPEVLTHKAREITKELGYDEDPQDYEFGFSQSGRFLQSVADHDASPDRWSFLEHERSGVLQFWYRQSPHWMRPNDRWGRVWKNSPPLASPGMVSLELGSDGRLRTFRAIPPSQGRTEALPTLFDWSTVFEFAHFDPEQFEEIEPSDLPMSPFDERRAWKGQLDGLNEDQPPVEVRIEAASFGGLPISFRVYETWTLRDRRQNPPKHWLQNIMPWTNVFLLFTCLIGSLILAQFNLRRGLGDRRGATRIALGYVAISQVVWLLRAHHTTNFQLEFWGWQNTCGRILFNAALIWCFYVALEPSLRRLWPRKLISWNRVLSGRFSDPLIARDLLIGVSLGVLVKLLLRYQPFLIEWLGNPLPAPRMTQTDYLLGTDLVLARALYTQIDALMSAMMAFLLVALLKIVCRSNWLTMSILFVIGVLRVPLDVQSELPWLDLTFHAMVIAVFIFVIWRGTLLSMFFTLATFSLLGTVSLALSPGQWYFQSTIMAGGLVLGGAIYAAIRTLRAPS